MDLSLRRATPEDVRYVADNLKTDDSFELSALGLSSQDIPQVLSRSSKVLAIGPEGSPLAICGVEGDWPFGWVWSLSTQEAISHWRSLHRILPEALDALGKDYACLGNIKDARLTRHIRWLKSLGFVFLAETHIGPQQRLFYEFARIQ